MTPFRKMSKKRAREALREIDEVRTRREHGHEPRLPAEPGLLSLRVTARVSQDPFLPLRLGDLSSEERSRITIPDGGKRGGGERHARGEQPVHFLRERGGEACSESLRDSVMEVRARQREEELHGRPCPCRARFLPEEPRRALSGEEKDLEKADRARRVGVRE